MTTAGLATVADAQGEEFAFPLEPWTTETAMGRMHLGEAGQAGEEVGRAAQ